MKEKMKICSLLHDILSKTSALSDKNRITNYEFSKILGFG